MNSYKVRSYIPERRQKGRRHWEGKAAQQQAVYANRRRVQDSLPFVKCYPVGTRPPARGPMSLLGQAALHCGSYSVPCRSMEISTFNQRSAMPRSARPCEWPQARICAYLFLLLASQTMLVRAQ